MRSFCFLFASYSIKTVKLQPVVISMINRSDCDLLNEITLKTIKVQFTSK